jgi:uncharacterized protein YjiS (DUF1127 family)
MNHVAKRQKAKPATNGLSRMLNGLVGGLVEYWQLRKQQRIDRDAFAHILTLDDHMLSDIGVTRGDVIWASRLPLSKNAVKELRKIAQ